MNNFWEDFRKVILWVVVITVSISIGVPIANLFTQPAVEEMTETDETDETGFGSSFSTDPETIIGITPTSTAISSLNTESVATTTPTTTDYFFLGPNVNKASVNFIVNATSTDQKSFLFSYEVSNGTTASTTLANFYIPLIPVSGVNKAYSIASTTHKIVLPEGAKFYNLTVPLCSNTYDGTDDVPTCSTGLYRFKLGKIDDSGIEVYAEIDRE